MRRSTWIRAVVLAGLAGQLAVTPAHAQFGKLKQKLKDQIAGKPSPSGGAAAAAAPAAAGSSAGARGAEPVGPAAYTPANKIAITAATVGQFITGLRAELAERDRLAAAAQTDANVKAFWHHRDRRLACDSLSAWYDAETERVTKAMQTASTEAQANAAVARMQKLQMQRNQPCPLGTEPELVQNFFDNLRRAESGMDDVGAQAAGLTRTQYGYLRERIAALILRGSNPMYRETVGYAPAEVAAVQARAAELKRLLARDFSATGERRPSSDY